MAIVTGDRYLEHLVRFVGRNAGPLLDGSQTLKLNPAGLHYVQSRLEALRELEGLLAGAPVDYLRVYVSDLGDHRDLEKLRRILRLLTSLKVISVLPPPARDPTPLSLLPFSRLRVLELRGCDLSTSAARGLLELRHTLEKLVCHNSTDALRHVFASRIMEIKDSPAWSRLSFVSCTSNGLVLMDESLQLLPVVETMDLSRNRLAKVDNLRKCTMLKNLDLGFNQLQRMAFLSEVSCPIVKLVLRNNALTTLKGLENLRSLKGLDLSYNIISSFLDLEILASLSCLQNLWLEGNPICCARWYRAHVFSFFSLPEKLKLDDRGISLMEYWERLIIFAKRQKQPAGYGFYFPIKDYAEDERSVDARRKKHSRLADIEDDEHKRYFSSESGDQESVSCSSGNFRTDESAISDVDSEIVELMNRVEYMKKERSILWLREFKEWLDQNSEDNIAGGQCTSYSLDPVKEKYVNPSKGRKKLGGSSKYAPNAEHGSKDGNSSSILEFNFSSTEPCAAAKGNGYSDTSSRVAMEPAILNGGNISTIHSKSVGMNSEQGYMNVHSRAPENLPSSEISGHYDTLVVSEIEPKTSSAPLTAIDELMRSRSSLSYPGSPPYYQQDILHRRLCLEEEFLQLSAESFSVASSDSDTSCSDDDSYRPHASIPDHSILIQEPKERVTSECSNESCLDDKNHGGGENTCLDKNSGHTSDCYAGPSHLSTNQVKLFCSDDILNDHTCVNIDQAVGQDGQKHRRKAKRRVALFVQIL